METSQNRKPNIRWTIRRDMVDILDIETRSFDHPWSEEDFLRVLRQRNAIGMTAEWCGRVAGFMVYQLHRDRIEILDFAVHPDFRRVGIGRSMMEKLKGKLNPARRTKLRLLARESDLNGLRFLRASGFRAVAVHRAHFADTGEDAYELCYQVASDAAATYAPANRVAGFTPRS